MTLVCRALLWLLSLLADEPARRPPIRVVRLRLVLEGSPMPPRPDSERPTPRRAVTVFCPRCNAKGEAQPVLSPMKMTFIEGGKPETVQPFAAPHFTYVCPRCDYAEIHEKMVTAGGEDPWK